MLAALIDLREEETLSCCRELMDAAFSDSAGKLVIDVLLNSHAPLSLRAIAFKCDASRRSILPEGRLRVIIDRLVKAGMVANMGTTELPRYCLQRDDKRVQLLAKIYGPPHFVRS